MAAPLEAAQWLSTSQALAVWRATAGTRAELYFSMKLRVHIDASCIVHRKSKSQGCYVYILEAQGRHEPLGVKQSRIFELLRRERITQ